jgi:hypothetical protein
LRIDGSYLLARNSYASSVNLIIERPENLDFMSGDRATLRFLSRDQARRLAHGNAERLFGGKVG